MHPMLNLAVSAIRRNLPGILVKFGVVLLWLAGPADWRTAIAKPAFGANCIGCHSVARSGMSVTGNDTIADPGMGTLKVFQVRGGEIVAIGINVTDGHNNYSLAMASLNASGVNNSAHKLVATADTSWTAQTGYYTTPISSSNREWTFNLAVAADVPADFYRLEVQIGGKNGGLWAQKEAFYLEVLADTPVTPPTLLNPTLGPQGFALTVNTVEGKNYRLEYKTAFSDVNWNSLPPVLGNGADQVLSDSSASGTHRFYRIRID
jgi:hypothetical protein